MSQTGTNPPFIQTRERFAKYARRVRAYVKRTRERVMNDSISWSELAELTHATQVERFNWCSCEDNEGQENPYADCPKEGELMNEEYLKAKVDLCLNQAEKDLQQEEIARAIKNLQRANSALARIFNLEEEENE
jgi:hypothetical protein